MNVLYCGYDNSQVFRHAGLFDNMFVTNEQITVEYIKQKSIDYIISYGYRHIIKPDVIEHIQGRIINLHISYLPWNRGADPNVWSFYDNTPKGVTIHQIDAGIDTGPVYVQEMIEFDDDETLESSYNKLRLHIEDLFVKHWIDIRDGKIKPKAQEGDGSFHRKKDIERIKHLLTNGYETKCSHIEKGGMNNA